MILRILIIVAALASMMLAADATVVQEFPPTNYRLAFVYGREMTVTYIIGVLA
jgi:hypothetical protein